MKMSNTSTEEVSRKKSSGSYTKLAQMAWTWHGAAERSRYDKRRLEKLDHRRLIAVYDGQAVMIAMVVTLRYRN